MDYIIPSIIKYDEKAVFFINEEDEKKVKKELIIWVANNVLKYNLQKHVLRDGNFSEETMKILRETAAWIEEKEDNKKYYNCSIRTILSKHCDKADKKICKYGR